MDSNSQLHYNNHMNSILESENKPCLLWLSGIIEDHFTLEQIKGVCVQLDIPRAMYETKNKLLEDYRISVILPSDYPKIVELEEQGDIHYCILQNATSKHLPPFAEGCSETWYSFSEVSTGKSHSLRPCSHCTLRGWNWCKSKKPWLFAHEMSARTFDASLM